MEGEWAVRLGAFGWAPSVRPGSRWPAALRRWQANGQSGTGAEPTVRARVPRPRSDLGRTPRRAAETRVTPRSLTPHHGGVNGLTLHSFWNQLPTPGRWLLGSTVFQVLGRGMTLPFTIIYLHEVLDLDLGTAGAMMALIGLVALAMGPFFGALIDRFGARVMIIGCSLTHVVGAVLLAYADGVASVAVAMAFFGITQAGSHSAFNVMISSLVTGLVRQTYFGINFALVNLGMGAGGVVGGVFIDVDRPETFTAVYLANALGMLVPVAIMLGPLRRVHGRARHAADGGPRPASYLTILRRPAVLQMALVSLIFSYIGYGQFEAGIPAFVRGVSEVSTEALGWAFGVNTAVIVLAQFAVLRRIQGHRRTRVVLVMAGVWMLSWVLLGVTGAFAGTGWAVAVVVAFFAIFGVGETMLQPTLPSITNDLAPALERGRYNALANTSFQLGAVIAPLSAGFLLGHDLTVVYLGTIVLGCAAMGWAALSMERTIPAMANGLAEPVPGR